MRGGGTARAKVRSRVGWEKVVSRKVLAYVDSRWMRCSGSRDLLDLKKGESGRKAGRWVRHAGTFSFSVL